MTAARWLSTALALALLTPSLLAGDWTNNGGNAARNGLSPEVGPAAPTVHWTGGASSIIAWQPIVAGQKVFVVRQTGFPPGAEPGASPIKCYDLDTGAELWTRDIPFVAGDWTTWLLGYSDGKVYASRSGNGGTSVQKFHALDQADGSTLWTSDDFIDPGPYDGVVFAPDGDLIIGNTSNVRRVSRFDGTTVWESPRICSVTSSCGVAVHDGGVYVAEPAPGGHTLRKLDLATGASLYESPLMIGFTLQNTPFVGPDGTVYLSRTQNNPITDFLYAFDDTGTALTERWSLETGWTTTSEWGCSPDGSSVYSLDTSYKLQRVSAATGVVLDTSASSIYSGTGSPSPHFVVDANGTLFVSNGGFANGTLYSFDADLTLRWSMGVTNVNQGGPALGEDGTLVVAGVGSNLFALRSETWVDLGGGTTGIAGPPTLSMSGDLTPGSTVTLDLVQGAPSALSLVWFSFASTPAPFLGGTLHAFPINIQILTHTSVTGTLNGSATFPGGSPGDKIWVQVGIVDASVPVHGGSLSNGMVGTVP